MSLCRLCGAYGYFEREHYRAFVRRQSCGIISELFDTTWLVSDVRLSENDDNATQRPGGTAGTIMVRHTVTSPTAGNRGLWPTQKQIGRGGSRVEQSAQLKWNWNKTETKQFQNCFKIALKLFFFFQIVFQFRFNCANSLRIGLKY